MKFRALKNSSIQGHLFLEGAVLELQENESQIYIQSKMIEELEDEFENLNENESSQDKDEDTE
ncbi:hypothetical protein [Campylobacter sp. FOBRC14]|uniref:hypothetical protein n=1 Tax=Campylobacter sp. FOBRC14 TaxID=936554 RepID=UPI00027A358E|nr:hypothetical protein [Campylobacter sp. FOBRC14]EJP75047.1 hypothetical protein HMPREF1139_1517 [Campylobacter sp. FOBRC14]